MFNRVEGLKVNEVNVIEVLAALMQTMLQDFISTLAEKRRCIGEVTEETAVELETEKSGFDVNGKFFDAVARVDGIRAVRDKTVRESVAVSVYAWARGITLNVRAGLRAVRSSQSVGLLLLERAF